MKTFVNVGSHSIANSLYILILTIIYSITNVYTNNVLNTTNNLIFTSLTNTTKVKPEEFNIILYGGAFLDQFSLELYNTACPILANEVSVFGDKFNFPFNLTNSTILDNQYITDPDSFPGPAYKLNFYNPIDNVYDYDSTTEPIPVNYATNYVYMPNTNPYDYKVKFKTPFNMVCDKGLKLFYPYSDSSDLLNYNRFNKSIITLSDKVNLLYGFELVFNIAFSNVAETKKENIINKTYIFSEAENKCFTFTIVLHNKKDDEIETTFETYFDNSQFSTVYEDYEKPTDGFYNLLKSLYIEFVYDTSIYKSSIDKNYIWVNVFSVVENSVTTDPSLKYINTKINRIYHVKNRTAYIEEHNFYEKITISYDRFDTEIPDECVLSDYLVIQDLSEYSNNGYFNDNSDKELVIESVLKIKFKDKLILCLLIELNNIIDLDTIFTESNYIETTYDAVTDTTTTSTTTLLDGKQAGNGRVSIFSFMCDSLNSQLLYLRSISIKTFQLDSGIKSNYNSVISKLTCGNNLDDSNTYKNAMLADFNKGNIRVTNISKNQNEYIKILYKPINDLITRNYNKLTYTEKSCKPSNYLLYPGKQNPYFEAKSVIIEFPIFGANRELLDSQIFIVNSFGTKEVINNFVNLKKMYNDTLNKRFFPNEYYDICVDSDSNSINVGFCNCFICESLLNLQLAYTSFNKQHICIDEFTKKCNCFDISSINKEEENIVFRSFDICTDCKYDSQCSFALSNAYCSDPNSSLLQTYPENYYLGKPLIKSLLVEPFENSTLDYGRVTNGVIKGNTCECSDYYKDLDYVSLNGNTYTYSVYAVQNSYSDRVALSGCFSCLYNKLKVQNSNKCDDECLAFEQSGIKYYTYPYGGSNCNKCFYSGEVMQFAKKNNNSFFKKFQSCVKQNKNNDFILSCTDLAKENYFDIIDLMSGLFTHFNVECPGRKISEFNNSKYNINNANANDSVCIPWLGYANNINVGLFAKKLTFPVNSNIEGFPLFHTDYECLNEFCEPSSKENCSLNGYTCVCYDSCPLGEQEYFVNKISDQQNKNSSKIVIEVPCSGRGICTYDRGCICENGYLQPNCSVHCSTTIGGCCSDDAHCAKNNDNGKLKCKQIYNYIGYCDDL